jgi:predicted DNA-binding transcriptional regulator AlpA
VQAMSDGIHRAAPLMRRPSKATVADPRHAELANDNWPPVLTRREAAQMCKISVQTFDSWVRKAILPRPIPGTRRWSRRAIERALAGEVGTLFGNDELSPFERWKRDNAH